MLKLKSLLFVLALLVVFSTVYAADGDYAVSKIPDSLRKNADAVLRKEIMSFEVISTKEAIQKQHYVITVLNENGDSWADFAEYYDKLHDVASVEGVLYDAMGKQIKKMKYKDLQDLSGAGDNNLIDDNRIKRHNFIIKFIRIPSSTKVEIHYKYTLFFPNVVATGWRKIVCRTQPGKYYLPC